VSVNITINGETKTLPAPCNISEMLQQNGYKDMLVAVAINNSFVPKSQHNTHIINEGDTVDIVAPMQGG
jgi:sulfur carrier protein